MTAIFCVCFWFNCFKKLVVVFFFNFNDLFYFLLITIQCVFVCGWLFCSFFFVFIGFTQRALLNDTVLKWNVKCVLCCVLASNARKRNIDFKQIHTSYAHTHTHPHTSDGIKAFRTRKAICWFAIFNVQCRVLIYHFAPTPTVFRVCISIGVFVCVCEWVTECMFGVYMCVMTCARVCLCECVWVFFSSSICRCYMCAL